LKGVKNEFMPVVKTNEKQEGPHSKYWINDDGHYYDHEKSKNYSKQMPKKSHASIYGIASLK
jgi:hypothetical protein